MFGVCIIKCYGGFKTLVAIREDLQSAIECGKNYPGARSFVIWDMKNHKFIDPEM